MNATYTETDFGITGYRFVNKFDDSQPTVGDVLGNSYTWDGDERTDDELDGTCAFDMLSACQNYAKYSKGCGWIITVGGYDEGRGDLANEILVSDAIVIGIAKW